VVRAGADGFVLESHTKGVGFDAAALMGVLAGPALAAAAMGGGGDAIVGFNEPEAESMNNGRALALNFLKEDTLPPAAQWCDVLVQNGMNQRFLVEPELINPAQPNEKICTWLFNKNLGGAKLEDLADTINTVLAFQSETTDWNGAGGQAEFANGERDAVVVVFADGHVELVSKANAEQLRWTP
jgi:prepilin-type processing-associated H-X9-DG protein